MAYPTSVTIRTATANGTPDDCEIITDCNGDGIPDECQLVGNDCNLNGIPDECDADCNGERHPGRL